MSEAAEPTITSMRIGEVFSREVVFVTDPLTNADWALIAGVVGFAVWMAFLWALAVANCLTAMRERRGWRS